MPVLSGSPTPTVSVQVPVPQPVQQQPRQPQPRPQPVPQTGNPALPAAPQVMQKPLPRAIVFPYVPEPRRMRRVGSPRRYGADTETTKNLLHQLASNKEHWEPGSDLRMVAADALQDQGNDVAAEQLRSNIPIQGYIHQNGQNLYVVHNGTSYFLGTHPDVIRVLEDAMRTGQRVHIHRGYTHGDDVGRDWLNEFQSSGRVGRSGGTIKVPLLVSNSRSMGGGPIGENIVKIRSAAGNRTLYQHPRYHHGEITIGPSKQPTHPVGVFVNGNLHAGFKDEGKARRWVQRMGLQLKPETHEEPRPMRRLPKRRLSK